MKRIGIVTDSHSGITQEEAKRLGIKVLPMPFYMYTRKENRVRISDV